MFLAIELYDKIRDASPSWGAVHSGALEGIALPHAFSGELWPD
jgi:hypothetical protein